jgi:hypothetical protein
MAKKKDPTIDSILKELRKKTHDALGRKKLTQSADRYWEDGHYAAVSKLFENGKVPDWEKDKQRVLPVAKKLGAIAKILAGKDKTVELWAAEAAHEAVKKDPGCPGIGAGGYCDF